MHDTQIKETLETHFSEWEAEQIVAFLEEDEGFSPAGEKMLAEYFVRVKEAGKSVILALKICEEEWEWNWNEQDPGIRGDRDIPGIGVKNYASILNLYCKIGIPLPKEYER